MLQSIVTTVPMHGDQTSASEQPPAIEAVGLSKRYGDARHDSLDGGGDAVT